MPRKQKSRMVYLKMKMAMKESPSASTERRYIGMTNGEVNREESCLVGYDFIL